MRLELRSGGPPPAPRGPDGACARVGCGRQVVRRGSGACSARGPRSGELRGLFGVPTSQPVGRRA
eukprot:2900575-Lingulodinium_polyedra.AAC.1